MGGNGKLWATVALLAALLIGAVRMGAGAEPKLLGGGLHPRPASVTASVPAFLRLGVEDSERFRRPSSRPALQLHYSADTLLAVFQSGQTVPFARAEDVAHRYFALLRQAANLEGYSAGCGSVGYGVEPYLYAWGLFTDEAQARFSLDDFLDSFAGIGYFTPLQLLPVVEGEREQVFFVEAEYIQAGRQSTMAQPTLFAYCYGLMTVQRTADGWRIQQVDWVPEDFLCAPEHGWGWDAEAFVHILYAEQYGIIEQVDRIDRQDGFTTIFASGAGREYRFQFIRAANGMDLLLHEQMLDPDRRWQEVSLLKDGDRSWKVAPGSPLFGQ